jgi:MEMO1 family protein
MQTIRREVVAGMFYPADPNVLTKDIGKFLSDKPISSEHETISAIVTPHAGYVYSGDCAAAGYSAISNQDFDIAVILAPSHHSNQFIFSQGKYSHYRTPLGDIPVNQVWLNEFENYPEFQFNAYAHEKEHSLEVQLPFLQVIKPTIEIVPILLGQQSLENSKKLAKILTEIQSKRKDKIMFIISTDLSHYYPQPVADKMDRTLQADLESLSEEDLYKHFLNKSIEACGIGGLFFMLAWRHNLTSPNFRTLQSSHSGMVSQDYNEVVGYLSGILTGRNVN